MQNADGRLQIDLAARVGVAPTLSGLTGRCATVDTIWQSKLLLLAGLSPASIRLEDGCLDNSATAA
jgi:hypothetical protein